MHGHLQDPLPLAALPPAERTRALARYRILQPCVEHGVPLTHVAHQQGLALRTVERWLARYRRDGFAGLARRGRRDRGHRRRLHPELTPVIEGLALRTRIVENFERLYAIEIGFWGATEQKTGLSRAPRLPHVEAVLIKR